MLPIVTEETRKLLIEMVQEDERTWKRDMIHHIKEDNPEINSLLLEVANQCLDKEAQKKIILAGYMVYKAIEMALDEENAEALDFT